MVDVDGVRGELVALEERRTRAWLERDRAALAALLDDAFVEINYVGRLDRRRVLDELFPRVRLLTFEPCDHVVVPAGDGAALLTYRCREVIDIGGQRVEGDFHVGALYVRAPDAPGGWRLRAWQITPWQGARG